ncbi:MAG: hypothetical protein WAW11_04580 [Patescibacteria group bacterium]
MKNYFKDKKNILIIATILIIIIVIIFIVLAFKKNTSSLPTFNTKTFKGVVINDNIKIPNTTEVTSNEGEVVPRGEYNIKLQPQSEADTVIITKAKLTLKEAHNLGITEAVKWSSDAKLVFIKSNGALGLDGKSSSWQLVYGSADRQKGYEIIMVENQIISAKEILSDSSGFDLPLNWYDSYEAIATLNLPQFSQDTISAISFYYSGANQSWAYGLANGEKTTSMWVQ